MSAMTIHKTYPSSPLSDSLTINLPHHPSPAFINNLIETSLSGNLDDYVIHKSSSGLHVTAEAKKPYKERYRSVEKRLSDVEDEMQMLKNETQMLKNELQVLLTDKGTIFLRSQVYVRLLLIVQNRLFSSLPNQSQLRSLGFADLPRMFAIWWFAWNTRDPDQFPLPVYISNLSPAIHWQLPLGNFLFKSNGSESAKGVVLRKAWEMLEPIARDLMMHCWCCKMNGVDIRNIFFAHPFTSKTEAEEILGKDLCNELGYLHSHAITDVRNAPGTFV